MKNLKPITLETAREIGHAHGFILTDNGYYYATDDAESDVFVFFTKEERERAMNEMGSDGIG